MVTVNIMLPNGQQGITVVQAALGKVGVLLPSLDLFRGGVGEVVGAAMPEAPVDLNEGITNLKVKHPILESNLSLVEQAVSRQPLAYPLLDAARLVAAQVAGMAAILVLVSLQAGYGLSDFLAAVGASHNIGVVWSAGHPTLGFALAWLGAMAQLVLLADPKRSLAYRAITCHSLHLRLGCGLGASRRAVMRLGPRDTRRLALVGLAAGIAGKGDVAAKTPLGAKARVRSEASHPAIALAAALADQFDLLISASIRAVTRLDGPARVALVGFPASFAGQFNYRHRNLLQSKIPTI
jgi:hypothetical protein